MTLTFNQWQIEIKNNLEIIESYAKKLGENPNEIHQIDITRLFDYVKSLDLMYDNIRDIEN